MNYETVPPDLKMFTWSLEKKMRVVINFNCDCDNHMDTRLSNEKVRFSRGALPYWVILKMCGQNGWVFQAENLRMGVNFLPKTCW